MTEIQIADVNFRLAMLDEVSRDRARGYYWLSSLGEDYASYQASVGGPTWDEVERRLGMDYLPELERFLLLLPAELRGSHRGD